MGPIFLRRYYRTFLDVPFAVAVVAERYGRPDARSRGSDGRLEQEWNDHLGPGLAACLRHDRGRRPSGHYDAPIFARVKVHRDVHVEVGKALYSVPERLLRQYPSARADAERWSALRRRRTGRDPSSVGPGGHWAATGRPTGGRQVGENEGSVLS